jgi:hypothetical protein
VTNRASIALLLALADSAIADPLAVRVAGPLPFTPQELDAALAVRVAIAAPGAARRLDAAVTSDGAVVTVTVTDRARAVSLDGERGADAARLVAFAILDLAADQLDPPSAARADAAAPAIVRAVDVAPRAQIDARAPRAGVLVWGRAGTRLAGELELAIAIAGDFRAIASGGATTSDATMGVTTRAFPLRAGAAWRAVPLAVGALELRATADAVIEQATAARSNTSTIVGGGAAVAWAIPIARARSRRGAVALVGAGFDAFATANDYRVNGALATTTPRAAWWAGVALGGEMWR